MASAAPPPATVHDLPPDVWEYVCLFFLPAPAFGSLLCTSKTLRSVLDPLEACWKKVAVEVFGADAAERRGPLNDDELLAVARLATPGTAWPDGLLRVPGPGGSRLKDAANAAAAAAAATLREPHGGWTPATRARALYEARMAAFVPGSAQAEETGRALAVAAAAAAAGGGVGAARAAYSSPFAWASRAAPAACGSHREAVARYAAVVGRFGADGARAARVWARLERFLEAKAPAVLDTLLPGWRAPPPPGAVEVPVCNAVAASAALHLGQCTVAGSSERWLLSGGSRPEWPDRSFPTMEELELRRLAGRASGLAGVTAFYERLDGGFNNPMWAADLVDRPPSQSGSGVPPPFLPPDPSVRFAALEGDGRGGVLTTPLDTATLRPFLVPAVGEETDVDPDVVRGGTRAGRSLYVSLTTGAVYAPAAAEGTVEDLPPTARAAGGGRPMLLVRADCGRGLLAWLEELATRCEAGLYNAAPALALCDARAWPQVSDVAPPGSPSWRHTTVLDGFPGLPLGRADLEPADLASLAAAWPDAGVGVALTGGALLVTASMICQTEPRLRGFMFPYKLSMRLLPPTAAGGAAQREADAAGTWPPHRWQEAAGVDSPPGGLPPLSAARLVARRWVMRDERGAVTDSIEGPGVVGLTPRLVAGAPPPYFAYASCTQEAVSRRDVFPASVLGYMEGALLFEGEIAGTGARVHFWARVPTMTLRVPEWRF